MKTIIIGGVAGGASCAAHLRSYLSSQIWSPEKSRRKFPTSLIAAGFITFMLTGHIQGGPLDESKSHRPLSRSDGKSVSGSTSESKKWTLDISLYGLAAGITGDMGVRAVTAELDIGFDDVLDNLEFAAMGSFRIGYDKWALNTEVLYLGVQGSKRNITAELDQLLIEPTVSYRVSKYFEPLVGVRYNHIKAELRGPGILNPPIVPSGTQQWWDPIIGANLSVPLGKKVSFNFRGDIGGFGVGSDLTWQVFPYLRWRFADWASLQLGYRWLYMRYETGAGQSRFVYDLTDQGPQLGFTLHF